MKARTLRDPVINCKLHNHLRIDRRSIEYHEDDTQWQAVCSFCSNVYITVIYEGSSKNTQLFFLLRMFYFTHINKPYITEKLYLPSIRTEKDDIWGFEHSHHGRCVYIYTYNNHITFAEYIVESCINEMCLFVAMRLRRTQLIIRDTLSTFMK